ncbi:exopolysaccharide biosynthesis polyprenyl glycosylphosphotransferase [Patescibacteria group bacterium]|nr:exopolysaccharide biosynthesis polyprenyl glycosylphosphotransferase [Patescibacteria group bacterium]
MKLKRVWFRMKQMFNLTIFRKILLFLGDLSLFYVSLIITLFIGFGQNLTPKIFSAHLAAFSPLFLVWICIFLFFELYELNIANLNTSFLARLSFGLLVCLMAGVIFFYLFPIFGLTPKTNLLILTAILWILIILWRKLALYLFSSYFQNRVAIIGITNESEKLAQTLIRNSQLGYKMTELIPTSNIIELPQKIKESKINTLILAEDLSGEPMLERILYQYLSLRVNLINLAQAYEIIVRKIPIGFIDQAWFLENLQEGQKRFYDKAKRILDILMALVFFILSIPFWLIVPIIIKIFDKGPVFYIQERLGKNLHKIRVVKFRTMKVNADQLGDDWSQGKEDPRITRVGRILRYSHIDEIPQIFDILSGKMSLVGPRPESLKNIAFLEKEIPYYHLRHLVKPGLTGWAQMNSGHLNTSGEIGNLNEKIRYDFEKVEYDFYYIKNRSFILDLNIFFKSLGLFFKQGR